MACWSLADVASERSAGTKLHTRSRADYASLLEQPFCADRRARSEQFISLALRGCGWSDSSEFRQQARQAYEPTDDDHLLAVHEEGVIASRPCEAAKHDQPQESYELLPFAIIPAGLGLA